MLNAQRRSVEAKNPFLPAKRISDTVTRVPPGVGSMVQNGKRDQTRNARILLSLRAAATCGARLFFGTPAPPAVVLGAILGVAGVALLFWPEVATLRPIQ